MDPTMSPSLFFARRKARKRLLRGLALVLAGALLGCTTSPHQTASEPGPTVGDGDQGTVLPPKLAEFLASAPANAVTRIPESPWGQDIEITAGEPYFAASGRQCRKLRIKGKDAAAHRALACKTNQGWMEQELVTRTQAEGEAQ